MAQTPNLQVPASSAFAARRLAPWMLLCVVLIAAAVYANSLRNGFAFDDVGMIRDNARVTNLEWSEIWTTNYWPMVDGIQPDALYRPLTIWSYLANQAIAPGVPWPFHLVNVILHALAAVLVCLLTWRILGDRIIALVVGLIFAVHPLHTEVVANVVGRAELMAGCWTLLMLLIYLPTSPLMEEKLLVSRAWWHGILVAACFFAAVLCKETPATMLIAIPFIDLWRWARLRGSIRPSLLAWLGSRTLRYYLPMGLAFGVYLAMRINACGLMAANGNVHPMVNLLVQATPAERMATPFGLLARYLGLTFWPVCLAADYSAPSIVPTSNLLDPFVAGGILTCLLALIASIRMWRKAPQVALIIGLFFCSYFLVSNVIRIGTIFGERLFYWPGLFVLMLAVWPLVRLYQQQVARRAAVTRWTASLLLAGIMIAMGWRTYVRNTDWADNICLAIATGRDNPGSAKACSWAGSVLVLADRADYRAVGKDLLDRAEELYPEYGTNLWEIAKYYGRQKDLAHALIYLSRAVRYEPGTKLTRNALGGIFAELKATPADTYMPVLRDYEAAHPDDESIHFGLALALHAQGKYEEADKEASQALNMKSGLPGTRQSEFHEAAAELADIEFDRGDKAQGINMFRQYVTRLPKSVDVRLAMAAMLITLDPATFPKAYDEADYNLRRAEALQPGNPGVRDLRATLIRKRASTGEQSASAMPHTIGPELPRSHEGVAP